MSHSKTYLNVPYAEKDTAKSLGAKWDAAKKKWYAPENLDISLFSKWNSASASVPANKSKTPSKSKRSTSNNITYAKDKSFVAYNGELPPWD